MDEAAIFATVERMRAVAAAAKNGCPRWREPEAELVRKLDRLARSLRSELV